jgi:hypothetical protein
METKKIATIVDFAAVKQIKMNQILPCPQIDNVDYALACISSFEEDLFGAEKTLEWYMANQPDSRKHELRNVVKTIAAVRTELEDLALTVYEI